MSTDATAKLTDEQTTYLETMLHQYIVTALWSSNDNRVDPEGHGLPLDDNYGPDDLTDDAHATMREDCADFIVDQWETIRDLDAEQVGHDFWLTRNHHGAGFWDGDYPEDIGQKLTDASHAYGDADLDSVGDGTVDHYPTR